MMRLSNPTIAAALYARGGNFGEPALVQEGLAFEATVRCGQGGGGPPIHRPFTPSLHSRVLHSFDFLHHAPPTNKKDEYRAKEKKDKKRIFQPRVFM